MYIDYHTAGRDDAYFRRMIRDVSRGWTVLSAAATTMALVIASVCFASGSAGLAAGVLSVVLAICCAAYPSYARRRALASISAFQRTPIHITLDEQSATVDTAAILTRFGWDSVTRVAQQPYAYLVWHGGTYRDLPRAGLTPEQDAELRGLLIDRQLLRNPNGAAATADTPDA